MPCQAPSLLRWWGVALRRYTSMCADRRERCGVAAAPHRPAGLGVPIDAYARWLLLAVRQGTPTTTHTWPQAKEVPELRNGLLHVKATSHLINPEQTAHHQAVTERGGESCLVKIVAISPR
jgi:hypothetical protein